MIFHNFKLYFSVSINKKFTFMTLITKKQCNSGISLNLELESLQI